jgi:multiple sugar transport system permease protein
LPGFAVFSLVMVYPTVQAFLMSLQDFSLVATKPSQWIGLTNYLDALSDPVFWRALANSGVYMVVTVPGQMVLGLACAIALKNRLKGRSAFRIMVYIPVITSWVVVSILFKFLFQTEGGLVNFILTDVTHLGDSGVDWFNGRWTALVAICALGVWKGVGWTMIIFLAALQSVPDQLYEAAQVDGAGGLAQFWHVTLPSIRRTLLFITIMLVIGAFNVFISVSLMTGGGPANQTQVPLTYLYRQAFNFLDFGYGSAIAFMLTALIALFSAVQFRLGDKAAEEAIA